MEKGACSTTPCGTEQKGTCCGRIIKGGILGGIVIFVWFMLSWHVIPWHANSILGFKDEKAVSEALVKNAPDSGVYTLPFTDMGKVDQKTDKPFAFVSVYAPGVNIKDSLPSMMIGAFVMSVLMALFLSCLLSKKVEGYCPMGFSLKVGLLVGIAAYGPMFVFYHFPTSWCLTGIADEVIAFGLAGAVVGKCIMKMKLGMHCGTSACGPKTGSCGSDAKPDDKK